MNCTVSGGTSPTAVILWPSTTVEKAELEPTVAASATGVSALVLGGCAAVSWCSTNTETEATPSVNTRWSTAWLEPGSVCAERMLMWKPGGRRMAFQAEESAAGATSGVCVSRTHWKPSVENSGLKSASGMWDERGRLLKKNI